MKVKELIKELMDGHLEDEIKIKLISVSMPDVKHILVILKMM
jgi:hypothetical protein